MVAKRKFTNGGNGGSKKRRKTTTQVSVSRFSGIETKFLDSNYAPTAIAAAIAGSEADPTTLLALNATAQGDGESERDGRRQCLKSVKVHGTVSLNPLANQSTSPADEIVFVALVLDTQSNKAQLNAEDVFKGTTPERPFRNLQYVDRFKVLAARTFTMKYGDGVWDGTNIEIGGVSEIFNFNKKLEVPVTYAATTGVIGSITDNSLHMVAISSSSNAKLEYNARVTFVG